MKRYLEYKDEKSHKFWEITLNGKEFTTRYGKIGANGTTKTKEFETEEKAKKEYDKLIKKKLKKGYVKIKSKPIVINFDFDFDLDKYKDKYENYMLNWGYGYPEYAGCEMLYVDDEDLEEDSYILPEAGDWVVNDLRGQSGTYGVSHEDFGIEYVELKDPDEYDVDYDLKIIKLKVDVYDLMYRYQRIAKLFSSWSSTYVTFRDIKDVENGSDNYEEEKLFFVEDPYLALYWLNHFGLTLDKRYNEVVAIIQENNLIEKLDYLKEPLAFFEKTDFSYNVEIRGGKDEYQDLFLIRRAYLVYWEQVYKNYNSNSLDIWWKSIAIYPKFEPDLIVRMRWLKNNLHKCNNWTDFDLLIKNEPKNTPLLSYVLACNPNSSKENKTKYADRFIAELLDYKTIIKEKSFARVMLWDVRNFILNKDKLTKAAKYYYKGKETSAEYKELVEGIKVKNLGEIMNVLGQLKKAFKGCETYKTEKEKQIECNQNVKDILDKLDPEILLETTFHIKNWRLATQYFVYLWNKEIANKKEAMVNLLVFANLYYYEVEGFFKTNNITTYIKDEKDPNFEVVKAIFDINSDRLTGTAAMFLLNVSHLPSIFNYILEIITQIPKKKKWLSKQNKTIKDYAIKAIYYRILNEKELKFSKSQIELILKTSSKWLLKYGDYDVDGLDYNYFASNSIENLKELLKKLNNE